uniref:Cytokine receptor like factor 2 n=1 Tax=Cercocebus atys TaxID=9531 RepID=A0A2K5MU98_CERAT
MGRLVLLWGAAVFLLGGWMALGQLGRNVFIRKYMNNNCIYCSWNIHRLFNRDEAYDQCTVYILQEGHTSGCLLDAEQQDEILYFSIRNGTHPVFTASRWIFYYLKPSSPKQVSFSWHQDAVTVTCSDLSYRGLLYEVQYRSPFDTEWQVSRAAVTQGDGGWLIYLSSLPTYYLSLFYHLLFYLCIYLSTYVSIYLSINYLSLSIYVSSICLLLSVFYKFLMPSVPDPKSEPALWEAEAGGSPEWITDTQNVAHLHKIAGAEPEGGPEESLVVQLAKTEAESPRTLDPQTEDKEVSGGSLLLPHQPPLQGGDVVTLGGFTFVMNDSSYVAL